jgi:hypothetical protein
MVAVTKYHKPGANSHTYWISDRIWGQKWQGKLGRGGSFWGLEGESLLPPSWFLAILSVSWLVAPSLQSLPPSSRGFSSVSVSPLLSLVRTLPLHLGPPSSRMTSSQDPSFRPQRPYFQVRSHSQAPGDTHLVKVTIPLSSMELDHIPIWRLDPMEWLQDDLISRLLIPSAKTLFPDEVPFSGPRWHSFWKILYSPQFYGIWPYSNMAAWPNGVGDTAGPGW